MKGEYFPSGAIIQVKGKDDDEWHDLGVLSETKAIIDFYPQSKFKRLRVAIHIFFIELYKILLGKKYKEYREFEKVFKKRIKLYKKASKNLRKFKNENNKRND